MQQLRRTSSIALVALLIGQLALPGLAMAAHHKGSSGGTQTTASPSPSPSPTPSASPSPSPSPTPSASPTPSPTPSPSASPSPTPSASPSPSPSPKTTGPNKPTGAPKVCHGNPPTWVYNSTVPVWQKADQSSFYCDTTTGYYLSPEYYFDTQSGWYEILPPSVIASLPSYYVTAPNVVDTVLGDLTVGSTDYNMAQALGLLNPTNGILVNGSTGTGSTNDASATSTGQNWVDLTNLVNVINTLQSNATSGAATANSNTQVGSSVTGAASVIADLFNLLASAWSWSNGNLNFFTQTLCAAGMTCNGNVNLDISQPVSGGGGSLSSSANTDGSGSATSSNSTNVNAQNAGNIVNNVNVGADSGNASAADNTQAGNVTSGNALAEVNIMNLINSFISSGSSFFGILNIFGTLNGNILFPAGFLNGLVPTGTGASGTTPTTTGPNSNNTSTNTTTNTSALNNSSTTGIDNNLSTNAASGNATASDNSTAGNVATGVANTVQSLFNLANTSIFGNNAVLVIVNIAGHWIGKIMNLPGGSTESALLTGGATVTQNGTSGPGSNNQATATTANTTNANVNSEGSITNNVNVGALSGNATANDNTGVGNVTSGNAQAVSSVANITNSVISAAHWFGVLVINVIGSWVGSVGVAGSSPNVTGYSSVGSPSDTSQANSVASALPKSGIFAPIGALLGGSGSGSNANVSNSSSTNGGAKVLAASEQPAPESVASIDQGKNMGLLFGLSALALLVAGALVSIDKKLKRR